MTNYENEQLATAVKNIEAIMNNKLSTTAERLEMLVQLKDYLFFLEDVQDHKHHIRLAYWEAAFEVYNYLRKTRQLERRVVGMRKDIVKSMHEELRRLVVQTRI
jgi:hypothetical protein